MTVRICHRLVHIGLEFNAKSYNELKSHTVHCIPAIECKESVSKHYSIVFYIVGSSRGVLSRLRVVSHMAKESKVHDHHAQTTNSNIMYT